MKFAVVAAVVVFALTITAQASVVPVIYGAPAPVSYTAVQGPALTYAGVPTLTYQAPATVVQAPVVVAADGTYVAQTRGAVHVAPLPGHLTSATSVNLEPAPGTI